MDGTGLEIARLADTLRAHGCVWAEEEARILFEAAGSRREVAAMAARRSRGVPLEYVVGSARFCGLDVRIDEGVFVPRRRTEYLARCAATVARSIVRRRARARVLDVCCGSGAIALVVRTRVPGVAVWATDISEAATACARRNLAGRGVVLTGDLFAPLAQAGAGRFDLIVANTPYVPTEEVALLPFEARAFEPAASYDGGDDGLTLQRRLFAEARAWLVEDGVVLTETSRAQAPRSASVARSHGFRTATRSSALSQATIVVASCGS